MIYSHQFVWLHFPKCAGVKVETIFEKYFSKDEFIHQDAVNPALDPSGTWHDSIEERTLRDPDFQLEDRHLVVCFRRLPDWLISRYSYEKSRTPRLPHDPELLLSGRFAEQSGAISHADLYAKKYFPASSVGSDRLEVIRTEFFEQDFKRVFGRFIDLSKIPSEEFCSKVNASVSAVPADIQNELRRGAAYDFCPFWSRIESLYYAQAPWPQSSHSS